MNRLKLDWGLSTSIERNDFVLQYINQPPFDTRPLNSDELETIANYILWGKNENGRNLDQEGLIELPRKNSTWVSQNVDSLDEMMESPTFNEASFSSINSRVPTKKVRKVFSRQEALENCPAHLIETYKSLWKEIDKTELTINFYEINHGKRTKEPRADLLKTLTEEEQKYCADRAKSLNQFKYLKLRHLLVELRTEQYTLKDSFSERIQLHSPPLFQETEPFIFEADIPVFPLGVCGARPIQKLLFREFGELVPSCFTEEQLKDISNFIWEKEKDKEKVMDLFFVDFTDLEMVYQLFLFLEEFEEDAEGADSFSLTSNLLNTLKFYMRETDLSESQREILDLKIKKEKNQDIASYINKKYGKSYTANYISTIFRQKIIPAINETADYHKRIVQNLFFKEEFKDCIKCGRTLLRDPINFVRKSRAKDGLSNRCKCCDKKDREEKKLKEGKKNG